MCGGGPMCLHTGWFFWLVPPRKVLSMELVPPNREKLLSSLEMAKIPTKKVKVHVRVCETFTFCCNLATKLGVWQALTWTFTFLVEILLFPMNLVIFSLLGGTSSILRTFLGGTSQKNHPVYIYRPETSFGVSKERPNCKYPTCPIYSRDTQ